MAADLPATPAPVSGRRTYLQLLGWSFALFNTVRLLAYLPTIWAIHANGDSSQHSLWTWLTWAGANASTALWLYEQDGRRLQRVSMVSACNAGLCLATSLLIVWYRC